MSSNAPCAACKHHRRKCTKECIFAPYFPPDNPNKFIIVHKVYGASNVGRILNELNPTQRHDAVNSLVYEAECRIKDPVYGCVRHVSYLQNHLRQVQQEFERAKMELATHIRQAVMQPILNSPAMLMQHQQQNLDPAFYQMAPYQCQGQQVTQDPFQQNQQLSTASREQEMLMAYPQQQQLQQEQLFMLKQQELLAQKEEELLAQKEEELLAQKELELFAQKHPELFAQKHPKLFAQQQQELLAQQQHMMQQQGMYVEQQQGMYVEQQQDDMMRFNDAGDEFVQIPADVGAGGQPELALDGGSFETHYQAHDEQAQSHHQQQIQFQELLLQSPQHLQHQFGAQPHGSQSQHHEQTHGNEEERGFGPL